MPVPSSFSDISTTPSSNSPQGSETVGTQANEYIQTAFAFIKQIYSGFLALTGGTLTGPLTLAADPAAAMQPVTKQYGDSHYIFNTVGGSVSAPVRFTGLPPSTSQGLSVGWNPDGAGNATLINNHGTGNGGFIFTIVNSTGTTELGRVSISQSGGLNTTDQLSEMGSRVWTAATFTPSAYQPAGDYATNTTVTNGLATKAPIRASGPGFGYVCTNTTNAILINWGGSTMDAAIDGTSIGSIITTQNLVAPIRAANATSNSTNQIGAIALGNNSGPQPSQPGTWVSNGTAFNSVFLWVRTA